MADTSLWPVVVGGLLTGLFTLGGIGAGLVASSRRDAAQERREAKKRRADKFEELVAAVYEFDHWLDGVRRRDFYKAESVPRTASPFAKVQSITSVYFPQFSEMVGELNTASNQLIAWMSHTLVMGIPADTPTLVSRFNEVFKPYAQKRDTLLDALKTFAQKEFQ
jgi:hypothetical protein